MYSSEPFENGLLGKCFPLAKCKNEPPGDKINKMACAPSEDSDQSGHQSSLIRVFAVCMKKAWVLSYPLSAQRRLWSDWADGCPGWSESSLGAQSFCWFCHEAAQINDCVQCLWRNVFIKPEIENFLALKMLILLIVCKVTFLFFKQMRKSNCLKKKSQNWKDWSRR